MTDLNDEQYRVLLVFRCALRQFLRWSGEQSRRFGLTEQQHQLLLTVRAHPGPRPPSIGELADYLLIRPHSAVELANRVEAAGLVTRVSDSEDQRVVRVTLTERGHELIEELAGAHLDELERVATRLSISQDFLEVLSREFSVQLAGQPGSSPEDRGA
ncbi:MAG: MarR family winged helix-turn-helix transcriptional regulator [Nocardioidaceae bacterium]